MDEREPPSQPEGPVGLPTQQQMIPEPYVFPAQLLERWIRLPSETYVEARLTKQDIDLFLFGLNKSYQAQQSLMQCIIDWSNGRVDDANKALNSAKFQSAEGQNQVRQFFAALMTSAVLSEPPQ